MNYRSPSRVATLLLLFALLTHLCAGTNAGAASHADKAPAAARRGKVSHALRDRLRRTGGSSSQSAQAAVQTAEVILQQSNKPTKRHNTQHNRTDVHVK